MNQKLHHEGAIVSYWAEVSIGYSKGKLGIVHEMSNGDRYFQNLHNLRMKQRGNKLIQSIVRSVENTFEADVLDELIDFALDNKDKRRFLELTQLKNNLEKVKLTRGTVIDDKKWAYEFTDGKEMIMFIDKNINKNKDDKETV